MYSMGSSNRPGQKAGENEMFTLCGPEKEGCVGNQTVKEKSCLVPCTGLYADIWDNSLNFKLKQNMQANMMAGRILVCLEH